MKNYPLKKIGCNNEHLEYITRAGVGGDYLALGKGSMSHNMYYVNQFTNITINNNNDLHFCT